MYLILLAVGLLVAASGFVTIGFGIPINAFSLGNTLIIAGTTAVVGGLLLVGLAAAVRNLQRIADGLGKTPMPRPAGRPVEAAEPPQIPPTAQLTPSNMRAPAPAPAPARPPEAIIPRPGGMPRQAEPAEPRFPTAPAGETRSPLDWLRPKSRAKQAETDMNMNMMEVPDEAPLSPRAPPRPAMPPTPVVEPALEPKAWAPSRGARSDEPRAAPRSESRMPADAASPKDEGLFDVVWPAARPATAPVIEPARRDPAMDAPSPMAPPLAPRRDEQRPATAERGPAILKSGVIDGMAYTLYADGSIEAELPQGTIRFASIDALRAHLEKHG